jgi:hypothetical protein
MRENVGQRSRKRGWPRCPPPATQHCLACALPRQSVWDGHWARRRREAVSVHWLDAGGTWWSAPRQAASDSCFARPARTRRAGPEPAVPAVVWPRRGRARQAARRP